MAVLIASRVRFVHYAWIIVGVAFLCMLLVSGLRSSFGVYLKSFETEFETSRASIALVASVSILVNGLVQPIVGQLLDRYGVRVVATASLLIACLGIVASSYTTGVWQLYITFGIVVSAAVGGPATVMSTVIAARWFVKHRGLVMGILSSGVSAGQLVMIPLAMQLNVTWGWRWSYILLGIGVATLALPIGLLLRNDPGDVGKQPLGVGDLSASAQAQQAHNDTMRTPLADAMRTREFWMLALGFFVCGYTAAGMIATHLVAYTMEHGFDHMTAAAGLGVMGAVNIVGTIVSGAITDRFGRKTPLAAIYFIRGLALLFLLSVNDTLTLNIFAVIFGMSYIATVPPTSALAAQIFGRLSVGVIFGTIFMSHQIGGALGSFITGFIFDTTGSYHYGLLFGAILCFVAAGLSLSIREAPVRITFSVAPK